MRKKRRKSVKKIILEEDSFSYENDSMNEKKGRNGMKHQINS